MAKEYCRDRLYPTKHLTDLPRSIRLGKDRRPFKVDYASVDQLGICEGIMKDAVKRGDNVGVDEFKEGEYRIKSLFTMSEVFQAADEVSGRLKAFMFLQFCHYQGSYDSSTATVWVFRSANIDHVAYAELANLASGFAKEIDVGYTQCLTQVALCFSDLHLELRRQGFITVAILPDWVEIAGAGVRENAIMVKQLGVPDRPARSREEVIRAANSFFTPEKVLQEYTNSVDLLPQIPGFPLKFSTPNGTRLILRNMRKEEDENLYETLVDAADSGTGYSLHEFPTLNYFRVCVLASSYVVTIEEEDTARVFGYVILQDSCQYRRSSPGVCESYFIVNKGFRGRGLVGGIESMLGQIALSLGYERQLRFTFFSNQRTLAIARTLNIPVLGTIPRGAYQVGVGWVDLFLSVIDSKTIAFTQKHESNSSNPKEQNTSLSKL